MNSLASCSGLRPVFSLVSRFTLIPSATSSSQTATVSPTTTPRLSRTTPFVKTESDSQYGSSRTAQTVDLLVLTQFTSTKSSSARESCLILADGSITKDSCAPSPPGGIEASATVRRLKDGVSAAAESGRLRKSRTGTRSSTSRAEEEEPDDSDDEEPSSDS